MAHANLGRVRQARRDALMHMTEALKKPRKDQHRMNYRAILAAPASVDPNSIEGLRKLFGAEAAMLAVIEFGRPPPSSANSSVVGLILHLRRLDRYERRAFSRRNRVMRAFSELQAEASLHGSAA